MRRRRPNQKREKYIMLASSLFVLSALTLTGFYVKERNKLGQENSIDFAKLEDTPSDKSGEIAQNLDEAIKEANASKAINPGTDSLTETDRYDNSGVPILSTQNQTTPPAESESLEEETSTDTVETAATGKAMSFSEEEGLTWPIVGNILVNYSMDQTVFFETLEQYKFNPGIVIEATVGESIASASDGKITSIYYDAQYGNCIQMDLGDGYELTYGQLDQISVEEGDYVEAGQIIAQVASPTKYFSAEGCNVFFKLTKNGEPVNPLNKLS